jgi:hypothetical protein
MYIELDALRDMETHMLSGKIIDPTVSPKVLGLLAELGCANAIAYLKDRNASGEWRTHWTPIPTQSIAFRWLRMEYNININIDYHPGPKLYFATVFYKDKRIQCNEASSDFYETCLDNALEYCLEHLKSKNL